MTVYLRDCSHHDGEVSLTGCIGATHKITEGTSYVDPQYATRMNSWLKQGVAILGSYHVLHTGNLDEQLAHWISTLDNLTPGWRRHPHWVNQIDGEKWPTDQVSPATIRMFAVLAKREIPHGWTVTYASRGQYGDGLAGLVTPLWNADYRGAGKGYPGDSWASYGGSAAGWAAYSGQVPTLLQWRDSPYDLNAYRGTLDQLKALIRGDDMLTDLNITHAEGVASRVDALTHLKSQSVMAGKVLDADLPLVDAVISIRDTVKDLATAVADIKADIAALKAQPQPQLSGDITVPVSGSVTAHIG